MKKFIITIALWIFFIILDVISLTIIRNYKNVDNELVFGYTYIEVPVSIIGCLIFIILINNITDNWKVKISLYFILFMALQLFNIYFFPASA